MRLLLALVWIIVSGCCCRGRPLLSTARDAPLWFTASVQPARGVFVVVHGLNQRPSSMDSISSYLASLGFHTYRVSLEGHDQRNTSVFPADVWTNDVIQAVRQARSAHPSLPLYMLGYSLGGLLTVQAMQSSTEVSPEKIILIAPALSLRTLVLSARLLTLFPPLSLRTPSLTPAKYRRFETTPLFWYSNIAELNAAAQEPPHPERLRAVPALVLLNPADELISTNGTEEWIADSSLSQTWHIELFRPQPTESGLREHLIVDEPSLGAAEWSRMRSTLRAFLQ